jgi:hypothetical protein
MTTCENCNGEGGWGYTVYGSRWDDYACDCEEYWEPCPDCGGTGWVYSDDQLQQLNEVDLIERTEDIDNNDGELSPEDERLTERLRSE